MCNLAFLVHQDLATRTASSLRPRAAAFLLCHLFTSCPDGKTVNSLPYRSKFGFQPLFFYQETTRGRVLVQLLATQTFTIANDRISSIQLRHVKTCHMQARGKNEALESVKQFFMFCIYGYTYLYHNWIGNKYIGVREKPTWEKLSLFFLQMEWILLGKVLFHNAFKTGSIFFFCTAVPYNASNMTRYVFFGNFHITNIKDFRTFLFDFKNFTWKWIKWV